MLYLPTCREHPYVPGLLNSYSQTDVAGAYVRQVICKVSEEKNKKRWILPGWSGGISEKMKQIGRDTGVVVWAPGHPGITVPHTQGIHSLTPGKEEESALPYAHDCENSVVACKAKSVSQLQTLPFQERL